MENDDLRVRFINARNIQFYWSGKSASNTVIDGLALHPWSFLYENLIIEIINVDDRGREADISLRLHDPQQGREVPCKFTLKYSGSFTGMRFDDYTIGLKRNRGEPFNVLMHLDMTLEEAAEIGNFAVQGGKLLEVKNPLKEHILATLRGTPIVGPKMTQKSQYFLEQLHGYKL
jgi:hypothetical protein